MRSGWLCLLAALLTASAEAQTSAPAQAAPAPAPATTAPAKPAPAVPAEEQLTVITSERLTFDYAKHFALFEENVVVTDPELKILADKMTVLFNDQNVAKSVRAEGNVYLVQLDKKAKSDIALYDVATGEIQLIGNPQVTRGADVLTGTKITFWRNDNKMKVDGRAQLNLAPDSKGRSTLSGGGLL